MILMVRSARQITPLDIVLACSKHRISCTIYNSTLSISDRKKRYIYTPSATSIRVVYFDSIQLLTRRWNKLCASKLKMLILVSRCDEYDIQDVTLDALDNIHSVCKKLEVLKTQNVAKPLHVQDMVTNAMKSNMQQSIVHKLSMSLYSVKDKALRDSMRKSIMRYLAGAGPRPVLDSYSRINKLMSDPMIPGLRNAVILSRSLGTGGPDIASAKTNIDRFDIAYVESYLSKK